MTKVKLNCYYSPQVCHCYDSYYHEIHKIGNIPGQELQFKMPCFALRIQILYACQIFNVIYLKHSFLGGLYRLKRGHQGLIYFHKEEIHSPRPNPCSEVIIVLCLFDNIIVVYLLLVLFFLIKSTYNKEINRVNMIFTPFLMIFLLVSCYSAVNYQIIVNSCKL